MADLKQNVSYEITADDKTASGTDSALANLIKQEKAAHEANEKQKTEAKETSGLFHAITNALSGNFEALGKEIAKAAARMTGMKLSSAALGAVGLAVTAVVAGVKGLVDWLQTAADNLHDIEAGNMESTFKTVDDEAKLFADEMERARKSSEQTTTHFKDQLKVVGDMVNAENELLRQQELAFAKTDADRDAINRKYDRAARENGADSDKASRAADLAATEDEIARIQKELEKAQDDRSYFHTMAQDATKKQASVSKGTGFWQGVGDYLGWSSTKEDIDEAAKNAQEFRSREQEAIKQQADLEMKLKDAVHKADMLRAAEDVAEIKDEAEAQKALNEDLAEQDAALAKQEEDNARDVAEVREKADRDVKEKRLQAVAELTAAEKTAAAESAAAQARLAAAQAQVQRAWGWYRNKDSLKAQMDEEKANAAAEKQFEKDFDKLTYRRDWRTATNLSVDQEAVRRVGLAREEEANAQKAVTETAANTARAAEALEKIQQTMEGED